MGNADQGLITRLLRKPADSYTVAVGPNKVTFLLSGEQTDGKLSVTLFEAAPPPAPSAPMHTHLKEDESMYVLEGEFQFMLEDGPHPAPAGSLVHVPKGTRHTIANVGQSRGKLLVVLSPPGFEKYWEEMSRLLRLSGGKPDESSVLALQEKYNMDMEGKARQFT